MTPRPDAEVRRAMRLLAARVLQWQGCPCQNCAIAGKASDLSLNVLAWAFQVEIGRDGCNPRAFADMLAGMADDEHAASFLESPRMAAILNPELARKDGA